MKHFSTPKEYAEAVSVFCVDKSRSRSYLYQGLTTEVDELVLEILRFEEYMESNGEAAAFKDIRGAILKEAGDVLFFLLVPDIVLAHSDEGLDLIHDPNLEAVWGWNKSRRRLTLRSAMMALVEASAAFGSSCVKEVREPESSDLRWEQRIKAALDLARALDQVCRVFGLSLQEAAFTNHDKLQDRFKRGVICGDGGNR